MKDKKGVITADAFQKYWTIQIENQKKYGYIKELNFTIAILKNGYKIMTLRCTQYIMKENQLLLKDSLEH